MVEWSLLFAYRDTLQLPANGWPTCVIPVTPQLVDAGVRFSAIMYVFSIWKAILIDKLFTME